MFTEANYSEHLYVLCLYTRGACWAGECIWNIQHRDCNLENNFFFLVNVFLHISKILAKSLHAVYICLPV